MYVVCISVLKIDRQKKSDQKLPRGKAALLLTLIKINLGRNEGEVNALKSLISYISHRTDEMKNLLNLIQLQLSFLTVLLLL